MAAPHSGALLGRRPADNGSGIPPNTREEAGDLRPYAGIQPSKTPANRRFPEHRFLPHPSPGRVQWVRCERAFSPHCSARAFARLDRAPPARALVQPAGASSKAIVPHLAYLSRGVHEKIGAAITAVPIARRADRDGATRRLNPAAPRPVCSEVPDSNKHFFRKGRAARARYPAGRGIPPAWRSLPATDEQGLHPAPLFVRRKARHPSGSLEIWVWSGPAPPGGDQRRDP